MGWKKITNDENTEPTKACEICHNTQCPECYEYDPEFDPNESSLGEPLGKHLAVVNSKVICTHCCPDCGYHTYGHMSGWCDPHIEVLQAERRAERGY